jgi:hypothetical protein
MLLFQSSANCVLSVVILLSVVQLVVPALLVARLANALRDRQK